MKGKKDECLNQDCLLRKGTLHPTCCSHSPFHTVGYSSCCFDINITGICTSNPSCWNKLLKKQANGFVNKQGEQLEMRLKMWDKQKRMNDQSDLSILWVCGVFFLFTVVLYGQQQMAVQYWEMSHIMSGVLRRH